MTVFRIGEAVRYEVTKPPDAVKVVVVAIASGGTSKPLGERASGAPVPVRAGDNDVHGDFGKELVQVDRMKNRV